MTRPISAVIFAGGRSSRMGEDKALLPFGNYPTLAEYQTAKLSKIFDKVYLSAKEDKFDFECMLIKDIFQESSPLVGLISIFETLKDDKVFILSVDVPFITEEVINQLLKHEQCSGHSLDAIVARSPSGIQPLCGIYNRSILPLIYTQLKNKNHKLSELLYEANTHFMPFEDDEPFTNLNHPQEYREAIRIFEHSSR